jgi:hypothetical protein
MPLKGISADAGVVMKTMEAIIDVAKNTDCLYENEGSKSNAAP